MFAPSVVEEGDVVSKPVDDVFVTTIDVEEELVVAVVVILLLLFSFMPLVVAIFVLILLLLLLLLTMDTASAVLEAGAVCNVDAPLLSITG